MTSATLTPTDAWRRPFTLGATVPVVWLLVAGVTDPQGGVLREVGALGLPLATALTAGFFGLVALFCRDLGRVLELLPPSLRTASPSSVWWMMALPLNFVEDFFIVANVSTSLERAGLERFAARGWALGWCSAQLVSLLPGTLGRIAGVVAVPIWVVHWLSVRRAIDHLSRHHPAFGGRP